MRQSQDLHGLKSPADSKKLGLWVIEEYVHMNSGNLVTVSPDKHAAESSDFPCTADNVVSRHSIKKNKTLGMTQ